MNTPRFARTALTVAALGLALGACGSDSESSDGPQAGSGAAVTVAGAWARTSPMNAENGAAYMELTSAEGDTLLGVEVAKSIAAMAQVHETVMATDEDSMGSMDSMDSSDTTATEPMEMTMQEIDELELPAGETVALAPGGYHIMLMELAEPLEVGDTITLELLFEKAGTQPVQVTVADDAP